MQDPSFRPPDKPFFVERHNAQIVDKVLRLNIAFLAVAENKFLCYKRYRLRVADWEPANDRT
jgi:hypothetical protein